jgi:phosphate-selective porin
MTLELSKSSLFKHSSASKKESTLRRGFYTGRFGRGAWELAARYLWVDLTSASVAGGVIEDVTYGVNWYWNYNFRMQFNYVHALRNASNPASIFGSADAFVMRMSFDI